MDNKTIESKISALQSQIALLSITVASLQLQMKLVETKRSTSELNNVTNDFNIDDSCSDDSCSDDSTSKSKAGYQLKTRNKIHSKSQYVLIKKSSEMDESYSSESDCEYIPQRTPIHHIDQSRVNSVELNNIRNQLRFRATQLEEL
jgi:hypothetical protein